MKRRDFLATAIASPLIGLVSGGGESVEDDIAEHPVAENDYTKSLRVQLMRDYEPGAVLPAVVVSDCPMEGSIIGVSMGGWPCDWPFGSGCFGTAWWSEVTNGNIKFVGWKLMEVEGRVFDGQRYYRTLKFYGWQ